MAQKKHASPRQIVADALSAAADTLRGITDLPAAYPDDGDNARQNAANRAQRNVMHLVVTSLTTLLDAAAVYARNPSPAIAASTAFGRVWSSHAATVRSAIPGLSAAGSRILEGRVSLANADNAMGSHFAMHTRTEGERSDAVAEHQSVGEQTYSAPTPTRRRKGVSPEDARNAVGQMV